MEKTLLSLAREPTVTLNVGNPPTPFQIHRNLLCNASPVFNAAFNGHGTFHETETQTMDLIDDDVAAFDVLSRWLYTGTCEFASDVPFPKDTDFTARLATFRQWPHAIPTAESVADAGFISVVDTEPSTHLDRVKCTRCNQYLCSWTSAHNALKQHHHYSPGCAYVNEVLEAQKPVEPNTQNHNQDDGSESYLMRLTTIYIAAEKYCIPPLKNSILTLFLRFRRATPRPKPPGSAVIAYIYGNTPTNAPLRRLVTDWYIWHVGNEWWLREAARGMLRECGDFAVDLACGMGCRVNGEGVVGGSPLDGGVEGYYEGV